MTLKEFMEYAEFNSNDKYTDSGLRMIYYYLKGLDIDINEKTVDRAFTFIDEVGTFDEVMEYPSRHLHAFIPTEEDTYLVHNRGI